MVENDTVEHIGSHGTTITKYLSIENKSFKLGKGERGEGAYFWGDNIYAKKLAVAWYINESRRGRYSKDKNKNCAVIWVKLKASKDQIIDLNEHECRYNLLKLQKEKGFDDNREDAHKLYDEFYDLVEKNLGYELKIVITEVYPPRLKGLKGLNIFPTQTCGMARCFV